jgi:nitrogen-specific signal transduction histidine kinase
MENQNHIGEQLNDLNACLNEIGDALGASHSEDNSKPPNLTDVVQVALKQVRKHLNSQVASFFLLNKDGVLARVGIEGTDGRNKVIDNQWLPKEQYKPGESFSGKAVPPVGNDSIYGSPNYSNTLNNNYKGMKYGPEYFNKLSYLKSGISVPLNGFNRTFGSLEVLNKKGNDEFTPDDVYRLMLIGNLVANHISHYKREYRRYVDDQLTDWLVRVESEQIDSKEINTFLAKALISETTPYKVCIIRKVDDQGDLQNLAKEKTEDISWEGRNPEVVNVNQNGTVTAQVFRSKKPSYIDDIEDAIEKNIYKFHNEYWIKLNNIKSMAVFPLLVSGQMVGTVTVATGYKHKFSQGNKTFLKKVASLLASIIVIQGYKEQLRATERELAEEKHKFFAASRQVSYDSVMKGFLHQYKNELIEFSEVFSQLSEDSSKSIKQKQQIIDRQKGWIRKRVAEINKEFREDTDDADVVNINKSIKYVATLFVSDEPDIQLSASYDEEIPEIEVSEAKIKDVIYNLVNNAIAAIKRAKPKKGQLSVATSIIPLNRISYIEIIIRDNGDGIPNEIQDDIFEQGFTTRSKDGGTGMGLFVVHEIITDYGGKISVDSKVGHGTIFKIYIPLKRYRV